MDENSCENETSESADGKKEKETENAPHLENVGIKVTPEGKKNETQVFGRRGSSFDASVSGPSTVFPNLACDDDDNNNVETSAEMARVTSRTSMEPVREETTLMPLKSVPSIARMVQLPTQHSNSEMIERNQFPGTCPVIVQECENTARDIQTQPPRYDSRQDIQPRVRLAPAVEEQLSTRRPSVGPPPSYSFVMKQKRRLKRLPSLDPVVTATSPPPSYAGSQGLYLTSEDGMCRYPSLAEPMWRSHSQPALCPRCGIIVLTTTHSHECVATHLAALALCMFGCWPCCVLPYCMNVCKNTYHHCPICQTFLGLRKPW